LRFVLRVNKQVLGLDFISGTQAGLFAAARVLGKINAVIAAE